MKKLLIYIIFLFLCSCKKEDANVIEIDNSPIYEPGSMEYGWTTAKKNGKDFKASTLALKYKNYNKKFGILFGTYTIDGAQRDFAILNSIKYEVGKYQVTLSDNLDTNKVNMSYYTHAYDGDITEDKYIIDEGANNYIIITEIDTIKNSVKGEFLLNLLIAPDQPKNNPLNPNKLKFTEGKFETRFPK